MKLIYCLMILLWPLVNTAQTIKPLNVGDNAPDVPIPHIINGALTSSSLAAFKGKLLILDFMATTCVSCIRALPELDSLQKKFKNRIQIMLVSNENPERIEVFLKKHPRLSLPFVANDSGLSALFPHVYISHVAWINPQRIVSAITDPEYVNTRNIEAVLNGRIVNWPVKREYPEYDFNQPILQLNLNNIPEQATPRNYYYTAVINYMPGIQKENKTVVDSSHGVAHISLINYDILDLYRILFQRYRFPLSHIKANIKNKERLFYNIEQGYYETWKSKNMYCIEALLPFSLSLPEQRQKLIEELNFYFGFQVVLKKQTVNCLILCNNKKISDSKKSAGKNGRSPASIVGLLNDRLNEMPVIDETIQSPLFKLPISENQVRDSSCLRKILLKYGYRFFIEPREVEFMIITDANKKL